VGEPFILLIDDDIDWLFLSKHQLSRAGIRVPVIEARDGEVAISVFKESLLKAETPLFVLLDINMPRLDGFETLAWIRSEPLLASVPVIMLSSSQQEADILRAKHLGGDAFWVKGDHVAGLIALYAQARAIRGAIIKLENALINLPGNLLSVQAVARG